MLPMSLLQWQESMFEINASFKWHQMGSGPFKKKLGKSLHKAHMSKN